jgi:two-component system sensor histidine kinase KdpD
LRTLAGVVVIAAITAALHLTTVVNPMTAGFAYLIAVLFIAAGWGLKESVAASIGATFCLNFFFLPPVGTLHIADLENWVALSAFLVTSLVASQSSELARRSQAVASRAEAARQSEQFKSTLLDAVAHEFKTPLTSIKAATSAMLSSDSLTADQRNELIAIVDQETDRLSRLTTEAFHLARAEAGRLHLSREWHDAGSLLREAVKQSTTCLSNRPIETDFATPATRVRVDGELFVVALKQFVENAAKYSPAHTPLRLRVEVSGGSVWFRVHNQGRELTERDRARVFERYYRSPENSKDVSGTGIGLAIARDIVRAHGGAVDVESGPGMGTEFSIRIPVAAEVSV